MLINFNNQHLVDMGKEITISELNFIQESIRKTVTSISYLCLMSGLRSKETHGN